MLGESQLSVYILADDLAPRQRERIRAQVQTALRGLPAWAYERLRLRIEQLGVRNMPLIVEPLPGGRAGAKVMSFGRIDGRPAVRLMPRLTDDAVDWVHDQRYLVARAVGYMASPPESDTAFWQGWREALDADNLRARASQIVAAWAESSDLGLLVEMFAARALNSEHARWDEMPAVRSFLESWR
jgi:hypothetical protein